MTRIFANANYDFIGMRRKAIIATGVLLALGLVALLGRRINYSIEFTGGTLVEARTSGLLIGSVIAAGLTSLAILGDYSYFGSTAATIPLGSGWFAIILIGVMGGLAGGAFGRIVVAASHGFPGAIGRIMKTHPIVTALICGLVVAICGIAGSDSVYGTGYEEAKAIIHGDVADLSFGPLKFIATVFSALSGIPGGIFAPSLAIGAGLGSDMSVLFTALPIGALALLGMVAYLTGVVQAPLTSFVIVYEMTDDNGLVLPLMAAALIAQASSKIVSPEGLYHGLARNYLMRNKPEPEAAAPAA